MELNFDQMAGSQSNYSLKPTAFGGQLSLFYKGYPIRQANIVSARAAGICFLLMIDCRALQKH
ncbi:MAG: hypothetical protein R3E55_02910 [Burkholderiaceae bacterium]